MIPRVRHPLYGYYQYVLGYCAVSFQNFLAIMKARHAAIVSFVTVTLASDPCQRLCETDGPVICTDGSSSRGDVCHAYFRINCDEHCYRNAETRETCPDTLPELTVAQAEAILASRRGPQRQRRRVVPLTGASVEASTRTEPLTTTESISEPAVFIDSETVVRTPAPPLDTTAPGPERRLRVVPVGQAVTAPSRPLTTAPPVISHHAAPSAVYAIQAIPSMSTPAEAADYIGAAFERRVDLRGVTLTIASVFSSLDASRWPATVSDDDTMDFWTRARGDDLLALALSQPNCGEVVDTECFALMLLVSHMPLANTHESSGLLFLERIGVMGFVDQNIDQLRHRLSLSGRNLYYSNG